MVKLDIGVPTIIWGAAHIRVKIKAINKVTDIDWSSNCTDKSNFNVIVTIFNLI